MPPSAEREADETIFALSSGAPPAAIGIVRISGSRAGAAVELICGRLPKPRHATLRRIRNPATGEELDRGLLLWFPGPRTATGEDLAELHLHGGRAVVAAVLKALEIPGLRRAEPGEFTRRAFANGVIDLAQAEGLADLLSAETEAQRRHAQLLVGGAMTRFVHDLQAKLLGLCAAAEALIEFADEDEDVATDAAALTLGTASLADEIDAILARPAAERLRDGIRVVLAGPPNAGKSTLLNALVQREAAITSPTPGTTRDIIEVPVAIDGVPFVLIDTAGVRDGVDEIERIGIARAQSAAESADILLWLGERASAQMHPRLVVVSAKIDLSLGRGATDFEALPVSAVTGEGLDRLVERLLSLSRELLPREREVVVNRRQAAFLTYARDELRSAEQQGDVVLKAEHLRLARLRLDALTGASGTEEMLDALFGRFCVGK